VPAPSHAAPEDQVVESRTELGIHVFHLTR
jgi:hypothetical protein